MLTRRGLIKSGAAMAAVTAAGCGARKGVRTEPPTAAELSVLDNPELLKETLRKGALEMFRKNAMDSEIGFFHMPSAITYRAFFAWDSGWHVIAMARMNPDAALAELETIFSVQAPDGHIPHEVRLPELIEESAMRKVVVRLVRRQYDEENRSWFIDPPSYMVAAEELHRVSGDARVLKLIPAMERAAEYMTNDRDLFGDGLVSIVHPWESGTDSAPVFDGVAGANMESPLAPFKFAVEYPAMLNRLADLNWDLEAIKKDNRCIFEDVGMNSLTAAGLQALAYLCEADGQAEKANRWRQKAADMVSAMEEIMWDEDEAFFYPRWDIENPKFPHRKCMTGALPLITGLVDDNKARALIERNLSSPEHFFTTWPVAFNSAAEVSKESIPFEEIMLWRGWCAWVNMSWMAARAARRHGRDDLARLITRKTAVMVAEHGFFEFYDPRNGEGLGAPNFTWPALVVDMIEEHGV